MSFLSDLILKFLVIIVDSDIICFMFGKFPSRKREVYPRRLILWSHAEAMCFMLKPCARKI